MKRAIYLDDRERDLARRCFEYLHTELHSEAKGLGGALKRLAAAWTRDEVADLLTKFQEPEETINITHIESTIQVKEV